VPGLPPVGLMPLDLAHWADGGALPPYVHQFDSGKDGPHVAVTALMHGNELCGAYVLDRLLRANIRPAAGKLTLAFLNIGAYQSFDADKPAASRFLDEDMNRVWDSKELDGPRVSRELIRARELRVVLDTVDLLLDLHSMTHAGAPLMLAGDTDKSLALARQVGVPAAIVRDKGHAGGKRLRDRGGFGEAGGPKAALLAECGQHWDLAAVDVAMAATLRFLAVTGACDPAKFGLPVPGLPAAGPVIEVTDAITIETQAFQMNPAVYALGPDGLAVIAEKGTVIALDGAREIRTPYDRCVMVMPSTKLAKGLTAVRLGRMTA